MKVKSEYAEGDKAVKFFLKILLSPEEIKKLKIINILSVDNINQQGFLSSKDFDKNGIPRSFDIEINEELSDDPIFQIIAHECVHIKQTLREELEIYYNPQNSDFGFIWKGEKWKPTKFQDPYWDSPWEIEAMGWEKSLHERFFEKMGTS